MWRKGLGSDAPFVSTKEVAMNGKLLLPKGWIAAALAIMLAAAACTSAGANNKAGGSASRPVVLTLADGEEDISNAQPFADAVKRLSNGTIQIEIKSPWRSGDPQYEPDLIKDVEAGKAQLGITATRGLDGVGIDGFQALQAPFLIDSIALEQTVLDSDIPQRMLQGLTGSGLVGLAILPGPLRRPLAFAQPLVSASDYEGARIWIVASAVTEETLGALGATADTRRESDLSRLTGVEAHLAKIDAAFAERGATITGNVVFEPRPNLIFMNRRAFDSLSSTQQSVLVRAAAQTRAAGVVYEADGEYVRDLCNRGVKIVTASEADLAGLRTAVQPVYDSLEANASTKAFIEEINSMRQALGDSPDAVSCPSSGGSSQITTTPTKLDGKWEVTYTRSEFVAAGAPFDEICCANWGPYTWTFDRGHWRQGGHPGASAAGTYVVNRDQITFYRNDHAYPASDTEIWGPYTWSVYRDTLTFEKSASFVAGPTGPLVKPWRKIGA
jgi:TRAP-type C4-dicarboxylate transport system substrate-binding protein